MPVQKKTHLKFSESELLADLSVENSGKELLATNVNSELNY